MSPRPPRNRVTTPTSPPFSLSLRSRREISLRERHRGISARVFSSISPLSSTLNGAIFHFRVRPGTGFATSSFLPSFLANFSSPNSRVHSVETYVEMKFRSNFSPLLCVSGKEINKKEDKAGGWFDRQEPVPNHDREEQSQEVSHVADAAKRRRGGDSSAVRQ